MINRMFGWTNIDVLQIGQGTWLVENGIDNRATKTLQIELDIGII